MDPRIARKINQEFSKYPSRKYPKGQIILFSGDEITSLYFVVEGKIRKYDISPRGDEFAVNITKPPVALPLTALLTGGINNYFYKAEQDVLLHIIPAKKALAFFKSNNDVLFGLLEWSYKSISGMQGRIIQLMSGNAKSRVIYELINECKNFSQELPDGSYVLSVTETDMAARSGLSRDTVSREINKLKKDNLVVIKGRGIYVPNVSFLEKML